MKTTYHITREPKYKDSRMYKQVWNYAWNSFGVSGVVSMCLYAEPN
jgi:hypothetical protein